MPDSPENQAAVPQPRAQKPGLVFPIALLAVLIGLWTGLVRDLAMGPCKGKETSERHCLMPSPTRRPSWRR
jgi:hypothetical protein